MSASKPLPTVSRVPAMAGRPARRYAVLVFLLAASIVYGWGRYWKQRTATPQWFTSTAVVKNDPAIFGTTGAVPADQLATIEKRIAAPANVGEAIRSLEDSVGSILEERSEQSFLQTLEDVRERLNVKAAAGADGEVDVSVSCTHHDPRLAALLANTLAQRFAVATVDRWKTTMQAAYTAARQQAQQAGEQLTAAHTALDAYVESELRTESARAERAQAEAAALERAAAAAQAGPPKPALNPDWLALTRQIEQLQLRRANLLLSRTQMHPSIQALDQEIDGLRRDLAAVPQWTDPPAQSPLQLAAPPLPPVDANTPAPTPTPPIPSRTIAESSQYAVLKAQVDLTQTAYDDAQRREQAAFAAMEKQPRQQAELAQAYQLPAAEGVDWVLLAAALAIGLAAMLATALITRIFGGRAVVGSLEQLQTLLHAPVVELIPLGSATQGK